MSTLLNESVDYFVKIMGLALGLIICVFIYTLAKDKVGTNQSYQPLSKEEQQRRIASNPELLWDRVEQGIHLQTGLKYGPGFQAVKSSCLSCHSAKLITQNRATAEGWYDMIKWMQATQGLPALGSKEPIIIDYLATNYAPEQQTRRAALDIERIEWYVLEE